MVRTPNTPNTRVNTRHRLRNLPQLLPVRVPQQNRLLQNLKRLLVPNAHGLLAPVDVVPHDDGVLARPGGDGDFDFGVFGGEFGEVGFYEAAADIVNFGLGDWVGALGDRKEDGDGIGMRGTYFMPRELPAQSQKWKSSFLHWRMKAPRPF